jgi:hypothetical protein
VRFRCGPEHPRGAGEAMRIGWRAAGRPAEVQEANCWAKEAPLEVWMMPAPPPPLQRSQPSQRSQLPSSSSLTAPGTRQPPTPTTLSWVLGLGSWAAPGFRYVTDDSTQNTVDVRGASLACRHPCAHHTRKPRDGLWHSIRHWQLRLLDLLPRARQHHVGASLS